MIKTELSKLKTKPTIITHVESFQVQGQFILKRNFNGQDIYDYLNYNFHIPDIEEVEEALINLIETYNISEYIV